MIGPARTLFVAGLAILQIGQASARPADVAGWRGARWGMTELDLERVFGKSLARLGGRLDFDGAFANRAVETVILGDLSYRAVFQMDERRERLQQVLLRPIRRPAQQAAFVATFEELKTRYGEPDARCGRPPKGGVPVSIEFVWRFPTTTVHLSFFDYYTSAMVFEDPNIDRDPLTPYYKVRRNNAQFLPRRALVRYHATEREDLMSAGCRVAGR